MPSEWKWRGVLVGLVTLLAIYLLIPSYYYFRLPPDQRNDKVAQEAALPGWFKAIPAEFRPTPLHLGLDLQGGIHLVMEVDVQAGIETKAVNTAQEMADFATKKGITGVTAHRINKTEVELSAPADKLDAAKSALDEYYGGIMDRVATTGTTLTYAFKADYVKHLKDDAVDQSIRAIRNRVDKFGVTEPTISRQGENHILVQLPGFKDPEQAKELIGKTAQLEFRIVDDTDQTTLVPATDLPAGVEADHRYQAFKSTDQKALQDFVKKVADAKAPPNEEFLVGHSEDPLRPNEFRTYLVRDHAELTGDALTDARVEFDSEGVGKEANVGLTFNRMGAEKFEKLTGENVHKRMAIVLDNVVNSAPVIKDKISGGSARITLGQGGGEKDQVQEARNLALVLKAGALPAPVTVAEQRTVGASLGPELITSGRNAVVAGLLLVVSFMLLYYNVSGIMADAALVLNGLLILSSLALFGASLSLPGIAGIVLTLGVSVDANVIINERIREELRAGKSPRTAVALGYDRAFSAIFDSNLTTVIAGVVLMQYGTGPIRGFAVTLIIGVIASMFTAIFVTRWMMDFLVAKRPERLSV